MPRHIKFAVIPTNGRPCLKGAVDAILPQVDKVIIINTTPHVEEAYPYQFMQYPMRSDQIDQYYTDTEGVNISAWWNQGLEMAKFKAEQVYKYKQWQADTWDVAILNDDAIVPPGWFDAVVTRMRDAGAAAGCSGPYNTILTQPGPVDLSTRMQGFAFILAGELGLRANQDLHWYFTDDYIDWESRKLGGMSMVEGFPVEHLHPNGQLTPEIHEQIARDAQTFHDLYGMRPW